VIVDDGIATGSTARAAIAVARAHGASKVVLAVPVAPPRTCAGLRAAADELICLEEPDPFWAVGQFYDDFSQTTDAEVIDALAAAST
jgi:putative phosphoribosyl transferase